MTQHHPKEEINYDNIYYLVAALGGGFIGLILQSGLIWVPILVIVGLLFARFFLAIVVRGHGDF